MQNRLQFPAGLGDLVPEYDEARQVWNGAIDRRPALIAGSTGLADVGAVLRFARDQDLPVAVLGGGHSVAGTSVCDDGVVVDLSPMKAIQVDPVARTARADVGDRHRWANRRRGPRLADAPLSGA